MPAQPTEEMPRPSRGKKCRPGLLFWPRLPCAGPGRVIPACVNYEQADFGISQPRVLFACFLISCTYNPTYIMYIRHVKGVLWYTGVICPTMNALDGSNKHQQFIETLTKKIHMMRTLSPSHHDTRYLRRLQ
jgi:hypothetical protein